jgi:hypothetical protein
VRLDPTRDLSGGLPIERESIATSPLDMPSWCENMLFALHDPHTNVALWLHLGTVPNDWTMWHDMNYAVLPNGDVLSMWGHTRTPPERRPAGPNTQFRCIEPFRRWHVTYDGYGLLTTQQEMTEGRARDGAKQRFFVDVDVEFITPAWDMHTASVHATGKGGMDSQEWAKEHYEQLYHATGTVQFGDATYPFDGYGWRDHSSGPRGSGAGSAWGGHCIIGCSYPDSGRGWGLGRYWTPDGTISLEGGWVVDGSNGGELIHAEVVETPRLRSLTIDPEQLDVELRWPGGSLRTTTTTRTSMWLAMADHLAVGKELRGPGLMYVLNHGPATSDTAGWEAEIGHCYVERSDLLNAFPEELHEEPT